MVLVIFVIEEMLNCFLSIVVDISNIVWFIVGYSGLVSID